MTELHLKPAPGLTVRDPDSYEPLATKGEKKPRTGFWLRRLKDGDVVMVTDVADTVAVAAPIVTVVADTVAAPKKGADK
ncbi:DUF2635 domain-containing protein [Yersinia massiliensis]|uniref:DUF2635 domain-containing protein n=1 Tax=Yersinia massiliensis TaxID=419257 RepID=UPI0028D4BCF8|nr:DUF2635 domain-containing protein [Yersinia massiliensis]